MENKLGNFVIKFLNDKIQTRKVIKCIDFFMLITDMGLSDESDEVINIVDYLDQNEVDINFDETGGDYYSRFKSIERKVKLSKMLKGSKTEIQKMIEKVESIKVQERPGWLEMYRDGSTDEKIENSKIYDLDENPFQRITDMLTQELKERLENEPGLTIEEIRQEIETEMSVGNDRNIVDAIRRGSWVQICKK
jgi:hypothetical protein